MGSVPVRTILHRLAPSSPQCKVSLLGWLVSGTLNQKASRRPKQKPDTPAFMRHSSVILLDRKEVGLAERYVNNNMYAPPFLRIIR